MFKTQLPNLFIIGAAKSATTTLWACLCDHPQIFGAKLKEPSHFSDNPNWRNGLAHYLSLYAKAKDRKYLIDASPTYTLRPKYEGVAQNIYEFNPRAKIIYIVRDPFERTLSHYRHFVMQGRERNLLLQALCHNPQFITASHYAFQLRPYLQIFGGEAVLVVTYEEFCRDAVAVCQKIFAWLGIDHSFSPPSVSKRYARTARRCKILRSDALSVRVWHRCKRYNWAAKVPRGLIRWARDRLPVVGEIDTESPEFIESKEAARKLLSPAFKASIRELESLLGRNFDEWLTKTAVADMELSGNNHFNIPLADKESIKKLMAAANL